MSGCLWSKSSTKREHRFRYVLTRILVLACFRSCWPVLITDQFRTDSPSQRSPDLAAIGGSVRCAIMVDPKNNKYKDYVRYATHCLEHVPVLADQDDRAISREMAAEWLKLAEAIVEQSTPIKVK
jgi:hypothetical protein